jgi:hypothetical protein
MEIELNPRWWPMTETNGHLSPRSETNIHHTVCHLPDPPYFLIPTTFKQHNHTERPVKK